MKEEEEKREREKSIGRKREREREREIIFISRCFSFFICFPLSLSVCFFSM